MVVALEHKVLVYNFADFKLLHQIETLANAKGLVAISSSAASTVLACPGLHVGQVRMGGKGKSKQARGRERRTGPTPCAHASMQAAHCVLTDHPDAWQRRSALSYTTGG